MKIFIETVANEEIKKRKGFGGADWWWEADPDGNGENLQVRVAEELSEREQMALAMHETAEALMCAHDGVTTEDVDAFDALHLADEKDPAFNSGDQPDAPYREQHTFATAIERILTGYFGIDWKAYDEALSKL